MPESNRVLHVTNDASVSQETYLKFFHPFGVEGDADLSVRTLYIHTKARFIGSELFVHQEITGSANSRDKKRGLEGSVAIAYKPRDEGPIDAHVSPKQAVAVALSQHETLVSTVDILYRQGKSLPGNVGSMERI